MTEGQPKLAVEVEESLRLFEPPPEVEVIASLADRYKAPPFTVLDRRQGYWRERGRQLKGMGIESELGREEMLTFGRFDPHLGKSDRFHDKQTSVFDPVICEFVTLSHAGPGDLILDPFAGGSVRGVIAAAHRRRYVGIDLSGAQVAANRQQADRIFAGVPDRPTWQQGDAREELPRLESESADLIFTCPPYGNLEVYSDDPADLSNMDTAGFAEAYTAIIAAAVRTLRQDRFAAIVVGNYRGRDGCLHDLGGLTVRAFKAAGCGFYNDAVIIDPIGTAAVRSFQFPKSRKLVRVHQQLLVFVKGDPVAATARIRTDDEVALLAARGDETAPAAPAGGFEANRAWSARFDDQMREIAAQVPHRPDEVADAPLPDDLERATDLLVLQSGPLRIACRARRLDQLRYADQFTIRSAVPTGGRTEIDKVLEGWGDYLIYGFGDDDGRLVRWLLADLEVFREWHFNEWETLGYPPGTEIQNGDGTAFRAYPIADLPPNFIIAQHDEEGTEG